MTTTRPSALAYGAWVAVCLLWGTTYLAIRVALETIPPMLVGGFRWTVAGLVLLVALKLAGERTPALRQWPMLAVLGVLLIGFGNGGVVWAEQTLPSGLTALLVATVPFWMVAIEWVAGSLEPLSPRRSLGLLIGFLGIVLLVWPELGLGGSAGPVALLATQLACVGWAIGSTYSRRREASENVLMMAASQMFFGGLAMLAAGSLLGEWSMLTFSTRSAGALVYLLLFGSIAGFSAYAYALKHLPVATTSLYAYVNPVIAVVLGILLLDEPWSPRLLVSGATVLLGMALVKQ